MGKSLLMNFRQLPDHIVKYPVKSVIVPLLMFLMGVMLQQNLAADSDTKDKQEWNFSGHAKGQVNANSYPESSIFRELFGSNNTDQAMDLRLKLSSRFGRWDFAVDYQFIAIHSDSLKFAESLPGLAVPINSVISDDRRWWNLTHTDTSGEKTAFTHRLDRLYVSYTTDQSVWRFGRQAISWGNGLMFTPMDVFNPFDPAAVDKEYKTGDDMLYGQWLFDSGNDLQGVAIIRRDPVTGDVESDQSSYALKYHGFVSGQEIDVLAAEHYGDQILGAGGIFSLGGALLRGDLIWTKTSQETALSVVTSLSYSWIWGGKNVSGILEYYYNGFGQGSGNYSPAELAGNPDLIKRVGRGELFTLGKHYLAASLNVEITPLFILTPNVFINLQDPSALVQLVGQYDWKENFLLLGALNFPIGGKGSEYGGPEAFVEGRYFSSGPGAFLQLAYYF
jgi:hypothetical protein